MHVPTLAVDYRLFALAELALLNFASCAQTAIPQFCKCICSLYEYQIDKVDSCTNCSKTFCIQYGRCDLSGNITAGGSLARIYFLTAPVQMDRLTIGRQHAFREIPSRIVWSYTSFWYSLRFCCSSRFSASISWNDTEHVMYFCRTYRAVGIFWPIAQLTRTTKGFQCAPEFFS